MLFLLFFTVLFLWRRRGRGFWASTSLSFISFLVQICWSSFFLWLDFIRQTTRGQQIFTETRCRCIAVVCTFTCRLRLYFRGRWGFQFELHPVCSRYFLLIHSARHSCGCWRRTTLVSWGLLAFLLVVAFFSALLEISWQREENIYYFSEINV